VRVETNLSFFLPGAISGEAQAKAIDQARRIVDRMATQECDILRAEIAQDCRL